MCDLLGREPYMQHRLALAMGEGEGDGDDDSLIACGPNGSWRYLRRAIGQPRKRVSECSNEQAIRSAEGQAGKAARASGR